MKKNIAMKWVKALRSGKYKQGRCGSLKDSDGGFCCLGVLIESNGMSCDRKYNHPNYLTESQRKKFTMKSVHGSFSNSGRTLAGLNDVGIPVDDSERSERLTFDEIADLIQICYKEL